MSRRQHPITDEEAAFWKEIRNQFYLRDDTVYLQGGTVGPSARPVIERTIALLREFESDPLNYRGEGLLRPLVESSREKLGAFVGASPDRLALVLNTTMGINIPAQGLPWERGREILMSDQEYGAVQALWDYIAARDGLTVTKIPLPTLPETPQDIVDAYAQAISDRTCMMLFSHVYYTSGLVTPIAELTKVAHAHGAMAIVDGAHAVGMVPLNLAEVGCDFYVTSCHKWLLAPKGVGMAYIDEKYQDTLRPVIIGHNMRRPIPNASRYDVAGTRDMTHFATLGDAIDYQLGIGWEERIRPYCLGLARYLKTLALEEIDGARLTIPMDAGMSGFITSFTIEGINLRQVIKHLWEDYRIEAAVTGVNGIQTFRISTHFYNSYDDLDRFVDAVKEIIATKRDVWEKDEG